MSSHHIVRDEQEPALYIHSADNFLLEVLGDLLEWSPTVIAGVATLKKVIDFGVKVDVVFDVTLDRDTEMLLASQMPVQRWSLAEQDINALLAHLQQENYSGLNIATSEDDLEHLKLKLNHYQGKMDCTVHTLKRRFVRINHASFEKWLNAGEYAVEAPGERLFSFQGIDDAAGQRSAAEFPFRKSEAGLVRIDCEEPPYWFVEYSPGFQ